MVEIQARDIQRTLGIDLPLEEAQALLERLEFTCERQADDRLRVTAPPFRLDIGEGWWAWPM